MDTKKLRQKILDLAIRGKLVPQDPNDEPASVLLERIRAEKQQMVKDGKLKAKDIKNDTIIFKGEDNLHYEKFQDGTVKCIEDEIPFIIPETWEWTRLNVISSFELGKTLDSAKNRGVFRPYLRSVNVRWNQIDLSDINEMKIEDNELERYSIKKGDLLICEGGNVGRSCVWNSDQVIYYQNALHRVRFYENIDPYFYMYIMMYYTFTGKLLEICKGVTIKHLTRATLQSLLFPLPPLNECVRITNKIKEVDNYISSLNNANDDILELIQITKAKILGLAIQGKLVPQNPDDEPASILLERIRKEKEELIKEGKLKREKKESIIYKGDDNSYYEKFSDGTVINIDDEIPFSIPDSWRWSRLSTICIKEIKRGKAPKYVNKSNTLVFAQKCNLKKGGIDYTLAQYLDECSISKYDNSEYLQVYDTVINSTGTGTLGRVGFIDSLSDFPIVPDSHVTTIRTSHEMDSYYIYVLLKSLQPLLEKSGEGSTNQKELKPVTLQNTLVPVPPLAEQLEICSLIKRCYGTLNEMGDCIN